jgi:hypothetical protein
MNMKNDYDDKYVWRKKKNGREKKASRMLEQLLGNGGGCIQSRGMRLLLFIKGH